MNTIQRRGEQRITDELPLTRNLMRAMRSYLDAALMYIPADTNDARDLRTRIDAVLWITKGEERE